ncbi:MAG: formate dehydrogenase accessory sulfurtransferase FdhD [Candidatus Eisenbacteria bacterium]
MSGIVRRSVLEVTGATRLTREDALAEERPLAIRVDGHDVAVTLRTPGHDDELALGFLAGEGLLARRADVASIVTTPAACADEPDRIELALAPGVRFDWSRFERHFAATAACGLCGRAHLDALRAGLVPMPLGAALEVARLFTLAERVRAMQHAFEATGGLHAAALCDAALEPLVLREDVGRHNAVDKVCGWLLEHGGYGSGVGLLWVSGRAGAELVLKAARARIPVMAAVGAPSSLAVTLAEAAGITLIGFLRGSRMNVYVGAERLSG